MLELFETFRNLTKKREQARIAAEKKDKERKAAWREYYRMNEAMDKIQEQLNWDQEDVEATIQAEKNFAPRKRPRQNTIDLTE